jgi:hypothetical protein
MIKQARLKDLVGRLIIHLVSCSFIFPIIKGCQQLDKPRRELFQKNSKKSFYQSSSASEGFESLRTRDLIGLIPCMKANR